MRMTMNRKLCPVFSLLLSFVSCGKHATDKNEVSSPNIQNQEPSANLILELNTAVSSSTLYTFNRPGLLTIPDRLKIKAGSLLGRKVSLTFNITDSDSMKCVYQTSTAQPQEMDVVSCYDDANNDLGNATVEQLPMQKNQKITMKLEGTLTPADVFAYFSVDWK